MQEHMRKLVHVFSQLPIHAEAGRERANERHNAQVRIL
jgi:hypothetical protein